MAQISEMQKPSAGVGQFFCALRAGVMAGKEAACDGALALGCSRLWAESAEKLVPSCHLLRLKETAEIPARAPGFLRGGSKAITVSQNLRQYPVLNTGRVKENQPSSSDVQTGAGMLTVEPA